MPHPPDRVLVLGATALLLCGLGAEVDHWHWLIGLTAHFCVQYLALAVALGLAWPFIRPRRKGVVLLLVVTMVLNAIAIVPLFSERTPVGGDYDFGYGPSLRVLSFNTWTHNPRTSEIWEFVDAQQPDIAFLFETSEALRASRATLAEDYQVTTIGEFIVLASHETTAFINSNAGIPDAVVLGVVHDDMLLHLVATHPFPPHGSLEEYVDATFQKLERYCDRGEASNAIVGDLNTTPWGWRRVPPSGTGARVLRAAALWPTARWRPRSPWGPRGRRPRPGSR